MGVKEEKVEPDGEILEAFGGGMFKIAFENGHAAIGYTSGKMRRYRTGALKGQVEPRRTTRRAAASSIGALNMLGGQMRWFNDRGDGMIARTARPTRYSRPTSSPRLPSVAAPASK
jgi:translation initiation factor IF-1